MPEAGASTGVALLVTRNFPPLLGGMENLNQRILRELAREWRVALCGPEGCAEHAPEAIAVAGTPIKPLPRFLVGSAFRAMALAQRFRPSLVVAGSGLAAPMAWLAARLSGAKLVVYLHGLDIIAPSRIYQWFWLPFIRACDVALVNSRNTGDLARRGGVRAERIHVLHPGTDMPKLDQGSARKFRSEWKLGDRPVLLSVGRLTRRKGLAEFVSSALPQVLSRFPSTVLLVIGEEATDALHGHGGAERERIAAAARQAGVADNVVFAGRCNQQALGAAYQAAQVHVFPVLAQTGDVEGFGMVALEAAAHGLRTVAFAIGGVPDAVADPDTGRLVAAGDYAGFADAIASILDQPLDREGKATARNFAATKDWTAFGRRLRDLLGRDP